MQPDRNPHPCQLNRIGFKAHPGDPDVVAASSRLLHGQRAALLAAPLHVMRAVDDHRLRLPPDRQADRYRCPIG